MNNPELKISILKGQIDNNLLNNMLSIASKIKYQPCSHWLGNYNVAEYPLYEMNGMEIPKELIAILMSVLDKIPVKQEYNFVTLQKIEAGEAVHSRIDTRNTVGKSISIPFGKYTGGLMIVNNEELDLHPGDILIRDSTNGYSMGLPHYTDLVTSGTKFILEIQTMIKGEIS